jgi:hypothetical protein
MTKRHRLFNAFGRIGHSTGGQKVCNFGTGQPLVGIAKSVCDCLELASR